MIVGDWFGLVDEPTNSEGKKAFATNPKISDNERTESETKMQSDFQKALKASRKRQADASDKGAEKQVEKKSKRIRP